MSSDRVRLATAADLHEVARVQRSANTIYAPYGLAEHLDALATPPDELARGLAQGLLWVATESPIAHDSGPIVGFALASAFGRDLHLDEIGVEPARARRGLGSQLLEAVLAEAARRGATRLTLLTVDFVPWTLGFYARHAFRVLRAAELDARLLELLSLDPHELAPSAQSFDGRIVLAKRLEH
ncbi:MAG: GNAT family N-acetyltransferase [Sandaracinaceae bacterium]|nr:GNAT family N-acetyltransferase [Sandaracinaceae bacterium]